MRDDAGKQMSEQEPAEIARMIATDHGRTISALRSTDPMNLRRSAELGDGINMTAEEVARLPLITHLEMHVEQLERLLDR